ncbi:hypothetical protein OWP15_11565 [Bacillus paranthracis]|uniref:hypothetical protein n=1 Tax=Bacillus paranthracis TaxID=2026186 RepID=UPI000789F96A|nr:hypothetical protein [Bacillus paranthracis]KYQ01862.1 hypothetical protein B4079_3144 [Bacillus cereus]MDK7473352.1 hypothetical protein [Bacillus paranthracis]
MNLLINMDKEYQKIKSSGQKYNQSYYHYQEVEFDNSYSNNSFLCLKQGKIKFLIVEEVDRIKLHLTDADIIDLISKLEKELFDILINSFYMLYENVGVDFQFTVNAIRYTCLGLKFSDKERRMVFNKQIETKADFAINFEDLVNLINLILAKEHFAEELTTRNSLDRIKRQLVKYISLSKFYRDADEDSKKYLQQIGYDINSDDVFSVYQKPWLQSKIDKKFNEIKLFENYHTYGKITLGES